MLAPSVSVVWAQWPQAPASALFIGNSYTFYNDLAGMVRQMAAAAGHDLYVESYAPGGYTFQQHSSDATTLSKIRSRAWDVVVLQEQSQRPSFPPSQVQNEVYPFARILADSIRANHPCTRIVFYMTWGRENGDPQNCQFYPPLCTYGGMQERLRSSYIEMAEENAAWTAPVGAAWREVRAQHPEIMLYAGDQSHPSLAGSYLAACVIYSTIFGSPEYLYTSSLDEAVYQPLQNVARTLVFDSLGVWKIGAFDPRAFADFTVHGDSVSFQNLSVFSDQFLWDFGDGNQSFVPLPSHVYALPGNFTVTLTAGNACLSDVYTFTVTIDTVPTDTVPTDTVPTDTVPTDTVPTDTVPTDTVPTDTVPNFRADVRRNGAIHLYKENGMYWVWKSKSEDVRVRVYIYDAKGRKLATLDDYHPRMRADELPSGLMFWCVPGRGYGRLTNTYEK